MLTSKELTISFNLIDKCNPRKEFNRLDSLYFGRVEGLNNNLYWKCSVTLQILFKLKL